MPLVLSRFSSSRPEDAVLLRMRNEAARRHRANRLTYSSTKAAEIEYRQQAAYEQTTKKPLLPKPRSEAGFSTPEWDAPRACWLVYALDDTTKWMAWDKIEERWISLQDYDRSCTPSPDQPKIETLESTGPSVPQRSNSDPLPLTKSRFTFRAVAQSIMKVLALQRDHSEPPMEV